MSVPQPLNDEHYASIEGLDDVFADGECEDSAVVNEPTANLKVADQEEDTTIEGDFNEIPDLEDSPSFKSLLDEPGEDTNDQLNPDEKMGTELSGPKKIIEKKLASSIVEGEDRVSRGDLISLLEGFVGVLKGEGDLSAASALAKAAPEELKFTDVDVEDKTQELDEMRQLVVEAQDTIIKLLSDRVEDRARIATLETELKLLPDLQEQADRAMAVAFKTEEFRTELHRVKYELEQNRVANIRRNMYSGPKGILTRVQRWFLKARGRSQLQFNDAIKENQKEK